MPEERVRDRLRLEGALEPSLHGRREAEGAAESRETIVSKVIAWHCDNIIFVISVLYCNNMPPVILPWIN